MADEQAALEMMFPLVAFIVAVVATGTAIIAHSAMVIPVSSLHGYAILLAILTIASGRFSIKVPGRPATVSVSEVFVFAAILLFGTAIPVLTVAIDGLVASLMQRDRRVYRTLFNIAEPAVSTWMAGKVFLAVSGVAPGSALLTSMPIVVPATVAMAGVFFVFNSGLSAVAVALETGGSVYEFWRGHAWALGVNYYAAASLATLAVGSGPWINFGVAGFVAPLLLLSYVAYREAARRVDEARRHVGDVDRLYRASVDMLAIVVDAKDQITHGHIRRVQRHTLAVAAGLGVSDPREVKAIEAGALLHDIGKLGVPDYVLNKPSTLAPAEFEIMKRHAGMGARILAAVGFPYPIVPIVRHHHERWDGEGYPDGLAGDDIPLGARILAVVDCFDALTSDRPYRRRLTDEQAIEILRSRRATFYDPTIVEKFIELIPELRRADAASGELDDTHAAVVAGLTRAAPGDLLDARGRAVTAPAIVAPPPDAQELINNCVARIGRADACLFALNAPQSALVVAHATPRIRAAIAHLQVPVGSGVSGWVAANRSTIRHADPALDIGELAVAFSAKSCASLPVFAGTDLFGALTVYVADPSLSDEKLDAVGLLGQEVGLLIARSANAVIRSYLRAASRSPMAAVS